MAVRNNARRVRAGPSSLPPGFQGHVLPVGWVENKLFDRTSVTPTGKQTLVARAALLYFLSTGHLPTQDEWRQAGFGYKTAIGFELKDAYAEAHQISPGFSSFEKALLAYKYEAVRFGIPLHLVDYTRGEISDEMRWHLRAEGLARYAGQLLRKKKKTVSDEDWKQIGIDRSRFYGTCEYGPGQLQYPQRIFDGFEDAIFFLTVSSVHSGCRFKCWNKDFGMRPATSLANEFDAKP